MSEENREETTQERMTKYLREGQKSELLNKLLFEAGVIGGDFILEIEGVEINDTG